MGKRSRTRQDRGTATGSASSVAGPTRGFWVDNRASVRFVGLFLGLLVAFQIAYYEIIVPSAAFASYLGACARIAAAVLHLLGEEVTATGDAMSAGFTMSIKTGCDGLQAMAILAIAVVAFPGSGRHKLLAVAGGVVLVLLLNVLRLVTLFWAGVHAPGWFQTLHVHVWPAFLILVALGYAIGWAARSNAAPKTA